MNQTKTRHFESDIQEAVGDLRGSLISVYASVGLDPQQPQDAVRKLGLGKNLAWKISKVIAAANGFAAVPHIPGASGWDLLVRALETAGAPSQQTQDVRGAIRAFEESVSFHAGDKTNLELIADSMGADDGSTAMELSRELAYQGLSGIWGVQSRARITTAFVVPTAGEPGYVDTARIAGIIGLRRLRTHASWSLFHSFTYKDDGATIEDGHEDLEPDVQGGIPMLLRRFCSPLLPPLKVVKRGAVTEIVQPAGPVGNLGSFDCFFGDLVRRLPRYRDAENAHAEFGVTLAFPVETLVFDLVVHRDIEIASPPSVLVYGRPAGGPDHPASRAPENLIPLPEKCVELVGRPPALATSLVPRYPELVDMALARLGTDIASTRVFRLTMKFPPMSSTVLLRWPLAEGT